MSAPQVRITNADGSTAVDINSFEGVNSLTVVKGRSDVFNVHLNIENNTTGNKAWMVVDLSNASTQWKHSLQSEIIIREIALNVNPGNGFVGDIELGFLSNVDASNGDFTLVRSWHIERFTVGQINVFNDGSQCQISPSNVFGPIVANSTLFQTDEDLTGPDGAVNHPSGDGDLVLRITTDGTEIDVGLSVCYITI